MVSISQSGLSSESTKGKHGKATVGQLLGLHSLLGLSGLALHQIKRVEAKVSGFTVKLSLGSLDKSSTGAELDKANSQEHERHGSLVNENVVGVVGSGNASKGEGLSGETDRDSKSAIGGEPSGNGKHGNTRVLQLGLTHPVDGGNSLGFLPGRRLDEPSKVLGNGGQKEGIEANIASHRSVQSSGTGKEGHCLGALGLDDHLVPLSARHGAIQGSARSRLGGRGGGKRHGRTGHGCNDNSGKGLHHGHVVGIKGAVESLISNKRAASNVKRQLQTRVVVEVVSFGSHSHYLREQEENYDPTTQTQTTQTLQIRENRAKGRNTPAAYEKLEDMR